MGAVARRARALLRSHPIAASGLVAGVAGVAYLVVSPDSADLAAQTFRADLFDEHGFVIWNESWYGGHSVPGYSLVYPPLGALLGPRLVGVLATLAATLAFAALAVDRAPDRAHLGALWFAFGSGAWLLTGRFTFMLGVAFGLAALLAVSRGHPRLGAAAALVAALTSPVAGLFTGLAGLALTVAGERRDGLALGAGAVVGLAILVVPFSTGGVEPFETSTFLAVVAFIPGAWFLLGRERPALRAGIAAYGVLLLAAFLIDTPLGGNATRLGALLGGPVLALAVPAERRRLLAVAVLPLLYWQLVAPVDDLVDAAGDPSTGAAYYAPLLAELDRRVGDEVVRVHVPPTRNRWEAVYVGERYPLARGWLRQLESDDFELFRDGNLDRGSYIEWLRRHGVSWVALNDADPDYLAEDERALLEAGVVGLRTAWAGEHWTLYETPWPDPLVVGRGELNELEPDGFELRAESLPISVAVRPSPYFEVIEGGACVEPDPRLGEGWTRISPLTTAEGVPIDPGPVRVRVEARLSLGGVLGDDRDCASAADG